MSIQILDKGDQCPNCLVKNVQRAKTEQGMVYQCRACNCAWAIAKDVIEEEDDDDTGE
jgi:hypothetical protein